MIPAPTRFVPRPLRRVVSLGAGASARALEGAAGSLDHARKVASFLRGHFAFEARPDDVFVATYPRSGTTLTQWMIYLLLSDSPREDFTHLNQVSPWYERSLATGELSVRDFERYPSPRVFKSHLPKEWLPEGARYVTVVRDGRDVALSYYEFYKAYLRFEGSFNAFFERFLAGRVQYGSWFKHVAGWRSHVGDPAVLVLRYEDVVRDREATARELARFLEVDDDPSRIARAVEGTSLDAMKAREAQFDHATALLLERGVTPRSFIRTGRTGEGETSLDPRQERAFAACERDARPAPELKLAAFLQ